MDHAIQRPAIGSIDEVFVNQIECEDDDFGLLAGLRIAVPVGLGIWAILIWGVIHFLI